MPNFMFAEERPFPVELNQTEFNRAPEMVARLFEDLPVLVLRKARIQHVLGRAAAFRLSSEHLAVGPCMSIRGSIMGFGGRKQYPVHRDSRPDTPEPEHNRPDTPGSELREFINANTTEKGPTHLTVVQARPHIPPEALPLLDGSSPFDEEYAAEFHAGRVDSDLFVPIRYAGILLDGDVAVQVDYGSLHKYRIPEASEVPESLQAAVTSEEASRAYMSGLYEVTFR